MTMYKKHRILGLGFVLFHITSWVIARRSVNASKTLGLCCPTGWVTSNMNCYKFVSNENVTWSDATKRCGALSSHLVHINSAQENEFIVSELKALLNRGDISHSAVWIGASDNHKEGFWSWYDTNGPILEYVNWNIGEPDAGDGSHEEDCACAAGSEDFRWEDRRCSEKHMYICEIPDGASSGTGSTNQQQGCEISWSLYSQSCYKYVIDQGRLEWTPASDYCKGLSAHLAIIESQGEDQFLAHEMGKLIETDHSNLATGVWVGGTDVDNEGVWVWRDSLLHTDKPISEYTNWHHGQPDSGDGQKEEDCLCLIGSKGFEWQDYRCRDNMFFICEKDAMTIDGGELVG